MLSYLLFNKLMETVDLGLEVCWQFLTHHCPCSDREVVALHDAVTPRRPDCKVIYSSPWQLPGRGDVTGQLTSLSRQHVVHAVICGLIPLSSGHLAFSPRLAFFVFFIVVGVTSAFCHSLTSFSLTPDFLSAA